jgi:hypothetical protein
MYATHHLPAAVVVAHVNVHTSTDQLTNGIDVVVIPETKKKTRTTTKVKQHETTTNKWTKKSPNTTLFQTYAAHSISNAFSSSVLCPSFLSSCLLGSHRWSSWACLGSIQEFLRLKRRDSERGEPGDFNISDGDDDVVVVVSVTTTPLCFPSVN